jgi:putative oxidoreductase
MKKIIYHITTVFPAATTFHISMLFFRILVSAEIMAAHGLKKVGVGVAEAEHIPNPLHLPEQLNNYMAIASNLIFPVFVILGLFTRLAVLPVLAVTLTGYFILHWNDPLLEKDMPFMYSVSFLLIAVLGPGKYSFDHFIHRRAGR